MIPEEGVLWAPADGTISAMFPTGHAIGMVTESGAEVLMHVGMDTVKLNGEGFKPLIKAGDQVRKGQPLLEFDMKLIQETGYSLVTPVLVTNYMQYGEIRTLKTGAADRGEALLSVWPKEETRE